MLAVIPLSFLVMSSMAEKPGTGPCKELKALKNFNQTKFVGNWYGYANYPAMLEPHGECQLSEVTENDDGSMRCVVNQLSDGPNRHEPEKIIIDMMNKNGEITAVGPKDSPYYNSKCTILSTDYVSYTVKGTCENVGPSSVNYYWILTRSPHPSQEVLDKVQEALKDEGIPENFFSKVDQNNCPSDF